MLKPMFGHRPKPKRFEYQYRYYDPSKEERNKHNIKFERKHKKKNQGLAVLFYALGLSVVIYIISIL